MSFYYLPPIKKTTRKWREGLFKLDDGLGKEVTHDYYEKIDPYSYAWKTGTVDTSVEWGINDIQNMLKKGTIDLDTPAQIAYSSGKLPLVHPNVDTNYYQRILSGQPIYRKLRYFPDFAPNDCPVPITGACAIYSKDLDKNPDKPIKVLCWEDFNRHCDGTKGKHKMINRGTYIEMIDLEAHRGIQKSDGIPEKEYIVSIQRESIDRYERDKEEEQKRLARGRALVRHQEWLANRTWWEKIQCFDGFWGKCAMVLYFIGMIPIAIILGLAGSVDDLRFGSAENRRQRAYWEWLNQNVK
jgi:hypothetical protein